MTIFSGRRAPGKGSTNRGQCEWQSPLPPLTMAVVGNLLPFSCLLASAHKTGISISLDMGNNPRSSPQPVFLAPPCEMSYLPAG